jgi:hypothetical protein
MLRIEVQGSPDTLILKLEGRLASHYAEQARTVVSHCHQGIRLVVDLTEVTFIDSGGEEVLSFFGRFGAEFVAQTSYTLDVCERLHLRLARGGALDKDTSGASRQGGTLRKVHARQPENKDI